MVEQLTDGRYKCERLGCEAAFQVEGVAMSHQADRIPHIVICATSELQPRPRNERYQGKGFVVAIRKLGEIRPLSNRIYQTPDAAGGERSAKIELAQLGNQIRGRK